MESKSFSADEINKGAGARARDVDEHRAQVHSSYRGTDKIMNEQKARGAETRLGNLVPRHRGLCRYFAALVSAFTREESGY
jgi:hypothetical protein